MADFETTSAEQYEKSRFVDEIDDEFFCPICFCVFRNPVMLQCQHTFCKVCIDAWTNGGGNRLLECPICRLPIATKPQTARMAANLSAKFKMFCKFKSVTKCPYIVPMADIEKHERSCVYRPVKCPNLTCSRMVAQHLTKTHRVECDRVLASVDEFYSAKMRGFLGRTYKNVDELVKMHQQIAENVKRHFISESACLNSLDNFLDDRLRYFKMRNSIRIAEAVSIGVGVAACAGVFLAVSAPVVAIGGVFGTLGALAPNLHSWLYAKAPSKAE